MTNKSFAIFENIVRSSYKFTQEDDFIEDQHPFQIRNIHSDIANIAKDLFDNGHFSQATFESFKFIDKELQRFSGSDEFGFKLSMQIFNDTNPKIKLNSMSNTSEKDEQKGYQFLFSGAILAIRNPRGHEYNVKDDPETCLDHLSLVSMLLRRLNEAGYQ